MSTYSHVVVLVFEQTLPNGNSRYVYEAYSSSNPDRPIKQLLKDIYYTIGYQPDKQPDNIHTTRGILTKESHVSSNTTLEERSQGIRCVIRQNGEIHTSYHIKGANQPYSQAVPQQAGTIRLLEHRVIEPFPFYMSDTESDEDSDED